MTEYRAEDNIYLDIDPITIGTDILNDIEIHQENGEVLRVADTIRQQRLEIEVLTDIIKEMVKTKNFDIDLDIEKRVEHKKFLNKLGENI